VNQDLDIKSLDIELVLGLIVSAYCLYAALHVSDDIMAAVIFLAISPIPLGFSLWAFRLRHQSKQHQTIAVNQLLGIKKQQLNTQLRYWHFSFVGALALWLLLTAATIINYMAFDGQTKWFVLAGVNGIVLGASAARYIYLRKNMNRRLDAITNLDI